MMHSVVLGLTGGTPDVDRISGDGLHNRRMNLRAATRGQSSLNLQAQRKTGKSFWSRGVCWAKAKLDFRPFCDAKVGNFLWSHTFSPSARQDMLLL
jgi:hypothetical protein